MGLFPENVVARGLWIFSSSNFWSFSCRYRPPDTKTTTMSENLSLRGTLEGHNGWVTQIATNPKYPDMILSSSRDKSLIVWKLTRDDGQYGYPQNAHRTRTLRLRRRPLQRRPLRPLRLVGSHPPPVGLGHRLLHPLIRVPHQGGPLRGLLC